MEYTLLTAQQLSVAPIGDGCTRARLSGAGFAGARQVEILQGHAGPLGDSYAGVGVADVDVSGAFSIVVPTLLRSPCAPGTRIGYYVLAYANSPSPDAPVLFPRKKVVYTVGMRAASTGNAGLAARTSRASAWRWALSSAALALVALGRAAVTRMARRRGVGPPAT